MAVGAGLFLLFKVEIPMAMWYVIANWLYMHPFTDLF